MTHEEAIRAAYQAEADGLRGLYPMAAQVLALDARRYRWIMEAAECFGLSIERVNAIIDDFIARGISSRDVIPAALKDAGVDYGR